LYLLSDFGVTSDSRRAIRRLSERLAITPVPLESMIDQLGKTAGNEYLHYLERPNEAHLQNAAQVLLIWQVGIVDSGEQNLHYWYRLMQKPAWLRRLPMRRSVWHKDFCASWTRSERDCRPPAAL
jgi:hypothetical protein